MSKDVRESKVEERARTLTQLVFHSPLQNDGALVFIFLCFWILRMCTFQSPEKRHVLLCAGWFLLWVFVRANLFFFDPLNSFHEAQVLIRDLLFCSLLMDMSSFSSLKTSCNSCNGVCGNSPNHSTSYIVSGSFHPWLISAVATFQSTDHVHQCRASASTILQLFVVLKIHEYLCFFPGRFLDEITYVSLNKQSFLVLRACNGYHLPAFLTFLSDHPEI